MNKSNDSIEGQMKALLQGHGVQEDNIFCDFTLTDQNEALGKIGMHKSFRYTMYSIITGIWVSKPY